MVDAFQAAFLRGDCRSAVLLLSSIARLRANLNHKKALWRRYFLPVAFYLRSARNTDSHCIDVDDRVRAH